MKYVVKTRENRLYSVLEFNCPLQALNWTKNIVPVKTYEINEQEKKDG